jgi:Transcriptional regulator
VARVTSSVDAATGEPDDQPAGEDERSRDFVRSLERGLAIIRVFNAERPSLTVSEIAHEAGLTRAAVRRFLLTLSELGYVYGKNNRYELTPQVLELGYSYLSALSFPTSHCRAWRNWCRRRPRRARDRSSTAATSSTSCAYPAPR